jgi:hypothetical protein
MSDYLIFTEVVNCGDIGKNAVESFYKFHDLPITVIGLDKDKFVADISPKITFIDVTDTNIYQQYHMGHVGTAAIWANLINQTKAKKILHFDSDVIFKGNILDRIIDLLDAFDLVGPIRNYKHNPNNRDDVRDLFDLTQTFCFGFNKEKITPKDTGLLKSQILNNYNPNRLGNIDFFDIVMQEIILNGGKRYFLDNELVGGVNFFGKRENKYGKKNMHLDYGDNIIHYASVGSGKFYYENNVNVVHTYKNYALEKYALYCKTVFGKELPGVSTESFKEFYE